MESSVWSPPEPRDLPRWRESLAEHMRSPYEHRALVQHLSMGRGTLSPQTGDLGRDAAILLDDERLRLASAELYYVSADMTRLALAAAETLEISSFHPDDLPAAAGFMVLEEPIAIYDGDDLGTVPTNPEDEIAIVAASWGPNCLLSSDRGMWVTFWSATNYDQIARALSDEQGISDADAHRQARSLRGDLSWDNEVMISYHPSRWGLLSTRGLALQTDRSVSETSWEDIRHTTLSWAQTVRAAWLLMTQQGVTDVDEEPLPRSARRRSQRAGYPTNPVRVVRIRHRANTPERSDTDESDTARTYRVRWTVRGHWRHQWYPSRAEHRPVWINPHVKGPADAPLQASETVHLLDQ